MIVVVACRLFMTFGPTCRPTTISRTLPYLELLHLCVLIDYLKSSIVFKFYYILCLVWDFNNQYNSTPIRQFCRCIHAATFAVLSTASFFLFCESYYSSCGCLADFVLHILLVLWRKNDDSDDDYIVRTVCIVYG